MNKYNKKVDIGERDKIILNVNNINLPKVNKARRGAWGGGVKPYFPFCGYSAILDFSFPYMPFLAQ